ncbi:MAG: hypothetical protein ACLFPM_06805 [Candidatus Izemoplasmatales bacterium]
MSIEIMVPVQIIDETVDNRKNDACLIAHLENGMKTEVYVKEDGQVYTKTDDEALIDYLSDENQWEGLKETTKISDNNIILRGYLEEDLEHLGDVMSDILKSNDGYEDLSAEEKATIEKINRQIPMRAIRQSLLFIAREDVADILVVEHKGRMLGYVVYSLIDGLMTLKPVFRNTTIEDIHIAAKALRMLMRKLTGLYNFEVFAFELMDGQEPLMEELGIPFKNFRYELSREALKEQMMFYLQ